VRKYKSNITSAKPYVKSVYTNAINFIKLKYTTQNACLINKSPLSVRGKPRYGTPPAWPVAVSQAERGIVTIFTLNEARRENEN
jgi:hypothetical protein